MTAKAKRNTSGLRPQEPSPLAQLFGPRRMVAQRWPGGIIDRVAGAAKADGITATEWTLRVLLERLDEEKFPEVEYLLPEGTEGCRHPTDALRATENLTRCGVCGTRV